jgi:hypothetical protein
VQLQGKSTQTNWNLLMEGKRNCTIKGGYEMETLFFSEICSEAEA